jgi:hypothetical protein
MNFYPNPDEPANHTVLTSTRPRYQLILGEIIHEIDIHEIEQNGLL